MTRAAPLVTSIGVGSVHVGLKDMSGTERRAIFQFESPNQFMAEIFATQNFNFDTNIGSNWVEITGRVFLNDGPGDDHTYLDVGGSLQRRRIQGQRSLFVSSTGIYAMDEGIMPAAFMVHVSSVTSGSPVSIFFGV